jgi:hypothetical protein
VTLLPEHELKMAGLVLADDGLLVVTSNIVPLNSISVEIIQDRHTRLFLSWKAFKIKLNPWLVI